MSLKCVYYTHIYIYAYMHLCVFPCVSKLSTDVVSWRVFATFWVRDSLSERAQITCCCCCCGCNAYDSWCWCRMYHFGRLENDYYMHYVIVCQRTKLAASKSGKGEGRPKKLNWPQTPLTEENRIDHCDGTNISVVSPLGIFWIDLSTFLPVPFGRFQPFSKTCFGPGAPETGPNGVFALKPPQSYGKRVAWVHPARPARRSFWVRYQKWTLHFGPLGPSGPFSPLGHPARFARRLENQRRWCQISELTSPGNNSSR